MANFPFIDKYGKVFYADIENAELRSADYIIIRKEENVMCLYNQQEHLFVLPKDEDISLTIAPNSEFSTIAYIAENNGRRMIKEQQNYNVYSVESADLGNTDLAWCLIEEILLDELPFDATQKNGLKNLLVRS